jgi:hypothetical protein
MITTSTTAAINYLPSNCNGETDNNHEKTTTATAITTTTRRAKTVAEAATAIKAMAKTKQPEQDNQPTRQCRGVG